MVEKFEAGKWYKCVDGDPFYIENVDGPKVTMKSLDIYSDGIRTSIIEPDKIRPGYYNGFREVSQEELERLVKEYQRKIEFFRRR